MDLSNEIAWVLNVPMGRFLPVISWLKSTLLGSNQAMNQIKKMARLMLNLRYGLIKAHGNNTWKDLNNLLGLQVVTLPKGQK